MLCIGMDSFPHFAYLQQPVKKECIAVFTSKSATNISSHSLMSSPVKQGIKRRLYFTVSLIISERVSGEVS